MSSISHTITPHHTNLIQHYFNLTRHHFILIPTFLDLHGQGHQKHHRRYETYRH
ncbi:hypothetical protein BURCENK562V_C0261 [Burkholderia cenocepacia K56-2Valvano]|nr:hypothetical protein BURCENK562V_C0261 [Burkholderia cenocepacia K56-2Valvano]